MTPLIAKDNITLKEQIVGMVTSILTLSVVSVFCKLMDYSMIIPLLLVFVGIHLYFFKKTTVKMLVNTGLLITLIVFITNAIQVYTDWSYLFIPVAWIAMLTMLLFNDLQLSFIMAFTSSIVVTMILGGNFGMMLTFFLGSLTGAYTIRNARTRGQLFVAGLFVSVIHIVALYLLTENMSYLLTETFFKTKMLPLLLNGFLCALFVSATLKIFEYLFGCITNFSLLELSDFNQPLLKRMILEAPGTYHHSLVVSNLSEAAADAIGANALLTRVGAYYHDIGKMVKSEYFTENQLIGGNKHDNMEPSMSRLVIMNHVKEGIELAKKYKLHQSIIDFIPQHHGTSLMYYFYQKALEEAEDNEEVTEENFRYPGPKPQTRETAITLLADSVEGATRALDEATQPRIEETVKKIINNKFIDGQLDECNLTLREIDKISETFIRILGAMYHGRVKYPEIKNGNSSRKSAEKDSSERKEDSPTDQKDSSQ